MKNKTTVIVVEIIPIVCAIAFLVLMYSNIEFTLLKSVSTYTMGLAVLGAPIFFVTRKMAKEDKLMKILGILDLLSALAVIGFYVLVIIVFGLHP